MKNFKAFAGKAKTYFLALISTFILALLTLQGSAQAPGTNPETPSHSQGASDYLHSMETDPNGVPNNSDWFVQPWIWAIVAAILILIVGALYKVYGKRDNTSETGL